MLFRLSKSPEEKGEPEEGSDASKSEISLVYEIALKRNLSVNFEVSFAVFSHQRGHSSLVEILVASG